MGVKLSAIKIIKSVQENEVDFENDNKYYVLLYNLSDFKDKSKYTECYYEIEYISQCDTIPYGVFNDLRELLAQIAGYKPSIDRQFEWSINFDDKKRFSQLLDFADNEGHIDNEHCKLIYNDLQTLTDIEKQKFDNRPFFKNYLPQLIEVFEIGMQENHCVYYS